MEDGDWKKADEYFDKVLDIDPQNGDAYAGKMCAEMKYHKLSDIAQDIETWAGPQGKTNKNYAKAIRYGSLSLKDEIEDYIAAAVDAWKKSIYAEACTAMDAENYQAAIEKFAPVKDYRDVDEKSAECVRLIEGIYTSARSAMVAEDYQTAMKQFARIKGYRDADEIRVECNRLEIKKKRDQLSRLSGLISVESRRTVGLKSDSTVVAAGSNQYGEYNVTGWRDIVAVSAGDTYTGTIGLKSDGTVVCTYKYYADKMAKWTDITAVSAAEGIAGLKSDGTVVCTKYSDDVAKWTDIVAVYCADHHVVGLKSDGTVVAAGDNGDGQCDVQGWKLFNSLATLEQERGEAKRQQVKSRKSEQAALQAELDSLKGLFTGKRRREIEARLAEIEAELKHL